MVVRSELYNPKQMNQINIFGEIDIITYGKMEDKLIAEATILGNVPSKSNCYVLGTTRSKGRTIPTMSKSGLVKKYEKNFLIQMPPKYRSINYAEYFRIELDVFYPSQRSDLDNSLKVILDCLQTVGTIKNDNKLIQIIANKALDKANPRIEFKLFKI